MENLNRVLFETKNDGTMRAMTPRGPCGPFFAWRRFGGLLGGPQRKCPTIFFWQFGW
jgi:hypothetical protein